MKNNNYAYKILHYKNCTVLHALKCRCIILFLALAQSLMGSSKEEQVIRYIWSNEIQSVHIWCIVQPHWLAKAASRCCCRLIGMTVVEYIESWQQNALLIKCQPPIAEPGMLEWPALHSDRVPWCYLNGKWWDQMIFMNNIITLRNVRFFSVTL